MIAAPTKTAGVSVSLVSTAEYTSVGIGCSSRMYEVAEAVQRPSRKT